MTTTASTSGSMPFPPMFRMPHRRPEGDGATDTTKTTDAASTTTTAASSTNSSSTEKTDGTAPEGFEGFEGKFPNFGGGNMSPGMMPPFGEREAFM